MEHTRLSPSRPKRRRWMHYTESQLVLATLANDGSITRNTTRTATRTSKEVVETRIEDDGPALITPSPQLHLRDNLVSSKRKHPKQLFKRSMSSKHVVKTDERDGCCPMKTPRRLFETKGRTMHGASRSRHVRKVDSPLPSSEFPTPKRSNTSRRKFVQSKRISTSWDSLASVSSIATKVSLSTSTTTENGTRKTEKIITHEEEESHEPTPTASSPQSFDRAEPQSPKPASSLIPPHLLSVLTPIGLPKKLRTSSQILEDEAKAARQARPVRQRLPRACKDRQKCHHYIEESEEEDDHFPWDNVEEESEAIQPAEAAVDMSFPARDDKASVVAPLHTPPRSVTRITCSNEKKGGTLAAESTEETDMNRNGRRRTQNWDCLSVQSDTERIGQLGKQGERELPRSYNENEQPLSKSRSSTQSHQRATTRINFPQHFQSSRRKMAKETSNEDREVAISTDENKVRRSKVQNGESLHDTPAGKRRARHEVSSEKAIEAASPNNSLGDQIDLGSLEPARKREKVNSPAHKGGIGIRSQEASYPDKNREQNNAEEREGEGSLVVQRVQPVVEVITESPRRKKHSRKKKSKKKKTKVRFAPLPTTTTTFSVRIRVKTSLNPGQSASNNGQLRPQAPALSESTVQSIANQVTQACLLQTQGGNALASSYQLENGNAARQPPIHAIENGSTDHHQSDEPAEKPYEVAVGCNTSVISDLTRERIRFQPLNESNEETASGDNDPMQHDLEVADAGTDSDSGKDGIESSLPSQTIPIPVRKPSPNRTASRQRLRPRENDDQSSNKRRRKLMTSGDSLAGSMADYWNAPPELTAPTVPKEVVAVKKPPARRGTARSSIRTSNLSRIEETVATDTSALPSSSSGCGGKCAGCRRTFDCMNCDNCLTRLQAGEFIRGEKSDCLGRICQFAKRYNHMDSLGMAAKNQASAPPTAKSLLDEDDFSYLSVEWKNPKSKPVKMLSRAARRWGNSDLLGKKKSLSTAGSISSVTTMTNGMGGTNTPIVPATAAKKSRRKGKNKKSDLHYMEMPMSTDGSVASWMEGRRALHALMQYDEADQDWV